MKRFAFALFLFATTLVAADAPAPMRALDFLQGDWNGSGWIVMGPQGRATFTQHETVRPAAGGAVVIIDGLGTSNGKPVHQAFAVVSYDAAAKHYRWRAYRATGEELDVVPEISDRKIVWGFRSPQGSDIRFTITLTDEGKWHETGELSRDGKWIQFFEMTLTKK